MHRAGDRLAAVSTLNAHEPGHMVPHVITGRAGAIIGRINLNSVIRGAFQSASVGYRVFTPQ